MKRLRNAWRTVVLIMWFVIYLPWNIANTIIEILENAGPEPIQRFIKRHGRHPAPSK